MTLTLHCTQLELHLVYVQQNVIFIGVIISLIAENYRVLSMHSSYLVLVMEELL